ncbi:MAG: hypothetical protein KF734_01565 [Saprospiraceae bacterium]|nr:hypothetical protein [Saprospiraceae bacterium]
MVAQNAIPEYCATAISTCIGFQISIPSLYFTQWFFQNISERYSFIGLATGGILGLTCIWRTVWKK